MGIFRIFKQSHTPIVVPFQLHMFKLNPPKNSGFIGNGRKMLGTPSTISHRFHHWHAYFRVDSPIFRKNPSYHDIKLAMPWWSPFLSHHMDVSWNSGTRLHHWSAFSNSPSTTWATPMTSCGNPHFSFKLFWYPADMSKLLFSRYKVVPPPVFLMGYNPIN